MSNLQLIKSLAPGLVIRLKLDVRCAIGWVGVSQLQRRAATHGSAGLVGNQLAGNNWLHHSNPRLSIAATVGAAFTIPARLSPALLLAVLQVQIGNRCGDGFAWLGGDGGLGQLGPVLMPIMRAQVAPRDCTRSGYLNGDTVLGGNGFFPIDHS